MSKIENLLIPHINREFKEFNKKIVPDTKYEMLGVKVPLLKKVAKELAKDNNAPYQLLKEEKTYYEEFLVCGLTVSYAKLPLKEKIVLLEEFFKYIDNWGVCDVLACSCKFIEKNKKETFSFIKKWINSQETYTVRFGVVCLLAYYINDEYIDDVLSIVKEINSNEYYVNMGIAWLISVALVKEFDKTLPYLLNKEFSPFIHNKAIQKARESFRISPDKKEMLKNLRIK